MGRSTGGSKSIGKTFGVGGGANRFVQKAREIMGRAGLSGREQGRQVREAVRRSQNYGQFMRELSGTVSRLRGTGGGAAPGGGPRGGLTGAQRRVFNAARRRAGG